MEQTGARLIGRLRQLPAVAFGLDPRSLALFRVLLGLLLLADTLQRLGDACSFYTDAGVLPREWLVRYGDPLRISLHLANGEPWFALLLLSLQAAAALALALGWRTRLAAACCFVLEASLLNRAPQVAGGGDALLACLLFWSLFLPLGARSSLDTAQAHPAAPPQRHFSWASAALVLQMIAVLLCGALSLRGPQWLPDFSALHDALQRDSYTAAAGAALRHQDGLLRVASACAYWLPRWAPLLLLLPWWRPLHLLALGLFALLEAGLALLFVPRLLPAATLVGLAALIDGAGWDALAAWRQRRAHQRGPQPLRIYYDGECAACLAFCRLACTLLVLPRAELAPAQEQARARALFEANRSWVVIDHDDHAYLKWPAAAVLLRRSPVFAPLGGLLSGAWTAAPGNAAYDFLGRRRAALAWLMRRLPPAPAAAPGCGRGQWLAAAALVLVLGGNLAALGLLPEGLRRPVTAPLRVLRLDQPWDWYSPLAAGEDGWFVVAGTLADGSSVDVLRPGQALSFDKPADVAGSYPDLRWHSYQARLLAPEAASALPAYGAYLCRRWNHQQAAAHSLAELKIIYLAEPAPGPAVEQRILWRQQCAAAAPAAATG